MKRVVTDVTTAQQSASVLHKMEAVEMAVTTDERAYVRKKVKRRQMLFYLCLTGWSASSYLYIIQLILM